MDLSSLTHLELKVALDNPRSTGNGFDTLEFRLDKEGTTVLDQSFTSLAAATAYFTDHVLDLGGIATGITGTLDLTFYLNLTSNDADAAFQADVLFGDNGAVVPEPSTWVSMALGLFVLAGVRRCVRRAASGRSNA